MVIGNGGLLARIKRLKIHLYKGGSASFPFYCNREVNGGILRSTRRPEIATCKRCLKAYNAEHNL